MDISGIRMYQAVTVGHSKGAKTVTYLYKDGTGLHQGSPVSLKLVEHMGVLIETDTYATIVSFNNLAQIILDKKAEKEASESEKPVRAKK